MTQLVLLYTAPALLLWMLLTTRRYPGERLLASARRPAPAVYGRVAGLVARLLRPTLAARRRSGVVVAWHLAGRAPPQLVAP